MALTPKEALAVLSLFMAAIAYTPYLWTIMNGKTKPHAFSWIIWGTLETIAFAAQRADNGGPGSWVTGLTCGMCFVVAALALKKGSRHITRGDIIFFIGALLAIPIWYFTQDPLWSVILISLIDMAGFFPTFRKAYFRPYEELPFTYFINGMKFFIGLLALTNISLITALYPASLVVTNLTFVALIFVRRRMMTPPILLTPPAGALHD